jgi:Metalloenzyme superfamily
MNGRARAISYVFLLVVVVGGGVSMDALAGLRALAPAQSQAHGVAHERGRAFVFIVDSLRFETAMNPALMPHLAELRRESTFARVTPSHDAVTVPSIRAAFTGEEQTKLLGFVSNFLKKRAGVRSVFTDLAAAGRRSAAFSDDAFKQFGEEAVQTLSNGGDGPTEVEDQNRTVGGALRFFASGRFDLVVLHVTYTDHVAHEDGIHGERYAREFHTVDAAIGALARAVREDDTLVVMGDHGHDEKGRHAFGLDVPTFALYRGARFRRALDLGTIPIRDHRYLLGWGLGLPLPETFDGIRHPEALVSSREIPSDYAATPAAADDPAHDGARKAAYFAASIDIVLAFVVWTFVTGPLAGAAPAGLRALAWVSTMPRFALAGTVVGALVGALMSAACLAWYLGRRSTTEPARARGLGGVLGVTAAAIVFWGLGVSFPMIRPSLHEPTYRSLAVFWAIAWFSAVQLTWVKRDVRYGALMLSLPVFAFFPTVYRYGSVAAMAPAWIGFLMCAFAAAERARRTETTGSWLSVLTAVAPVLFLVPFLAADSSDYRFDEWKIYAADASPVGWVLGAAVAKVVLLWPRASNGRARAFGLVLATLMVVFERARHSTLELVCGATILLFAGFLLRARGRSRPRSAPLLDFERLAWIAGLLMIHHALTRSNGVEYLWRDWLLAAVLLSGRMVRRLCPEEARDVPHAVLLFFAFLATGWVTFAWTVHRLEWGFLYDWFSAPFVERHVAFFVPLILARYLLPLVVARLVLASELDRKQRYPGRAIWFLVGWKVASLFLMTIGIGCTSPTTEIYLEGAEETAIAGVLSAALL